MTSRHTNPATESQRALAAAVLAPLAPRLSQQITDGEADALATWREEIGKAIAVFDEEIASIARDRGAPLWGEHLAADADPSELVCDLRDAACDLAAAAPEPEYDHLTAADYGVGQHRIGGLGA